MDLGFRVWGVTACCAARPGLLLPARIRSTRIATPVGFSCQS